MRGDWMLVGVREKVHRQKASAHLENLRRWCWLELYHLRCLRLLGRRGSVDLPLT